jgi:hypothetical protein
VSETSTAFEEELKEEMGNKQPDDDPEVERELNFAQIDSFGAALAKNRAECIAARQTSHIEEIWIEDEEFYEGIDEANRSSEKRTDWHQKPPGQTSGLNKSSTRSSVFPNITGPFVDAGTARLADIILPVGKAKAWSFDPTPIPELIAKSEGDFEEMPDIDYNDPNAVQEQAATEELEREDALRQMAAAKKLAVKAETRIVDWHIECKRKKHVRKVIEDSGRMGVGVLKGPFNKIKKRTGYIDKKVQTVKKITPHSKWIDPWNFFPAKDCGEDIQNGDGVWERDYVTMKQLREFMDDDTYLKEQILRCLEEGPQKASAVYKETPEPIDDPNLKSKFELWYYHGTAEREDLEAGGCDCQDIEDPHMPAALVLVNNHVIRYALNDMEADLYPYSVFSWKRRSGYWAGIGIARQIRVAQKVVVGATRNLMDNAGLAAGPMIVFRQGAIFPADGIAGIAPRKVFYIGEDEESITDATKAIGVIKVDMLVDDLIKIVQFGMKLAEDTTGLPLLLQGQGGSAPDTVGGLKLLQNNTAPPLRRLARAFDDDITEPEIERYYIYLLLYGEDNEKGDFFINSQGSSTLVERDLQDQELGAMGSIVIDPRYKLSADKWAVEFLKSRRFDPENFTIDEDSEEYQSMVSKAQQADEMAADPRLQIAEMGTQVKAEDIASRERVAMTGQQLQSELAVWARDQDQLEKEAEKQIDLILAAAQEEGEGSRDAGQRQDEFSRLKAKLAEVTMQINANTRDLSRKIASQERLAGVKANSDRMPMKTPVEPRGKAAAGMSVQE